MARNNNDKIERLIRELVLEVAKKKHAEEEARQMKGEAYTLHFELAWILATIRINPRLTAKELAKITGRPLKEIKARLKDHHAIIKKKNGYESKI